MQPQAVTAYRSPRTQQPLEVASVEQTEGTAIVEGTLRDPSTGEMFPIRKALPRFVPASNYANSFGFQWNRYRRVQLDSVNGSSLSWDRFFEGTGWDPSALKGRRVLEAGCGAGRFSEVLLRCGAELYSFDFSNAVEAAWLNLGHHPNWNLCQADIFQLPFPPASFDYVFCFGVLQHTPDPRRAFFHLTKAVKPGGRIAVDSYKQERGLNKLAVKYWYRPLTKHVPHSMLLRAFETYLPAWLHVDRCLNRVPVVGPWLGSLVPCWNKWSLPVSRQHRVEWTILDTFDAFSPQYDLPQTEQTIQAWCAEADLDEVSVRTGGNGIEAAGRKAA